MGYYTHYSLEVSPSPDIALFDAMLMAGKACDRAGVDRPQDVIDFFAKPENAFLLDATHGQEEDSELAYALGADLRGGDSAKWYDHESDLKALSEKYPSLLLTLHGTSEEAGDVWKKYFKGGKMQVARAKIEIEAFDPKQLK